MDRAFVFLDIDGTILRRDNTIPASAEAAIREALSAGHQLIINTGRPFSHIVDAVRALPFSGYICSCGAQILYQGQTLKHLTLSHEQCTHIRDLAHDCKVELYLEGENGLWLDFANHPTPQMMQDELERFRRRGFPVDQDKDAPDFVFDKFCTWSTNDSDLDRFVAGMSELFTPIRCTGYLEMVRNGCSKAAGIRELLEHLGADPEHTYAFGDSSNDIPMLQAVAHSAVIGSAPAHVQACAEFVSTRIDEDGLANCFRHFGLI